MERARESATPPPSSQPAPEHQASPAYAAQTAAVDQTRNGGDAGARLGANLNTNASTLARGLSTSSVGSSSDGSADDAEPSMKSSNATSTPSPSNAAHRKFPSLVELELPVPGSFDNAKTGTSSSSSSSSSSSNSSRNVKNGTSSAQGERAQQPASQTRQRQHFVGQNRERGIARDVSTSSLPLPPPHPSGPSGASGLRSSTSGHARGPIHRSRTASDPENHTPADLSPSAAMSETQSQDETGQDAAVKAEDARIRKERKREKKEKKERKRKLKKERKKARELSLSHNSITSGRTDNTSLSPRSFMTGSVLDRSFVAIPPSFASSGPDAGGDLPLPPVPKLSSLSSASFASGVDHDTLNAEQLSAALQELQVLRYDEHSFFEDQMDCVLSEYERLAVKNAKLESALAKRNARGEASGDRSSPALDSLDLQTQASFRAWCELAVIPLGSVVLAGRSSRIDASECMDSPRQHSTPYAAARRGATSAATPSSSSSSPSSTISSPGVTPVWLVCTGHLLLAYESDLEHSLVHCALLEDLAQVVVEAHEVETRNGRNLEHELTLEVPASETKWIIGSLDKSQLQTLASQIRAHAVSLQALSGPGTLAATRRAMLRRAETRRSQTDFRRSLQRAVEAGRAVMLAARTAGDNAQVHLLSEHCLRLEQLQRSFAELTHLENASAETSIFDLAKASLPPAPPSPSASPPS